MLVDIPYDRESAVAYAHEWAYRRNPNFYDFSNIGGDCTNYASQCVYAGCNTMNFTPTYGWYYLGINNRAPAWTSVEYIYNFLTTNEGIGPYAKVVDISEVEPGDLVQIKFYSKTVFGHTPVIVTADKAKNADEVFVAAHSMDCDCRQLSTYKDVVETRFLRILGARRQEISIPIMPFTPPFTETF